MTFKQNVLSILTKNPEELPLLIDSTKDKRFLLRVLNSYMPYSTGIEIETNGALDCITKETNYQSILNCIQFNTDHSRQAKRDGYDAQVYATSKNYFSEHRICIRNWQQAIAVKRLCLLLLEHCDINPQGGIHYHINFPEIKELPNWLDDQRPYQRTLEVREYLQKHLDEFNMIMKYMPLHSNHYQCNYPGKTGTNTRRVGVDTKNSWINIRRNLGTIEVRMAFCHFNYTQILSEIVQIQAIMRRMRASLGLAVNFEQL